MQPRSRKTKSKIGTGIPRSQSKIYPVAPACLILVVKRILDILSSSYRLGTLRMRRNLLQLMKTTIGTADECLMRHYPMPLDDCPRVRDRLVRERPLSWLNNTTRLSRLYWPHARMNVKNLDAAQSLTNSSFRAAVLLIRDTLDQPVDKSFGSAIFVESSRTA